MEVFLSQKLSFRKLKALNILYFLSFLKNYFFFILSYLILFTDISLTVCVVINAQPDSFIAIIQVLHVLQEEAVLLLVSDGQNVRRIIWGYRGQDSKTLSHLWDTNS